MLVIQPHCPETGIALPMAEIYLEINGQVFPPVLFNIRGYKKLFQATSLIKVVDGVTRMDACMNLWDAFFKPVNNFYQTLSAEAQYDLYSFYKQRAEDISLINTLGYREVASRAADDFYALVVRNRLADLVVQYPIAENFPIPSFAGVVLRVQDTEKMSFREPEYYLLTGISIFCKMLCPVWGAYIEAGSSIWSSQASNKLGATGQGDQKIDEMFCATMVEPILDFHQFRISDNETVKDKFLHYMKSIITSAQRRSADAAGQSLNKGVSIVAAFNGFSERRQDYMVWCSLLVRKFTNIDLLQSKCNIMTYLNSNIKEVLESFGRVMTETTPIQTRTDPGRDADSPQDESSFLEHNARVSQVPIDTPLAAKVAVNYCIPNLLRMFEMPEALFTSMMAFYRLRPIQPTVLNKALVAVMVSVHIGGSSILKFLDADPYTALFCIVQFRLAIRAQSTGFPESMELVHLMTANRSETKKVATIAGADRRMRTSLPASTMYKDCLTIFGVDGEVFNIKNHLNLVLDHITEHEHTYNTAVPLMTYLGIEDMPVWNTPVQYDDLVMHDLCSIYVEQYKQKGT